MVDRFESLMSLLGDDVSVRWLITLLHFLWQGAVVGGVVAIAGRLLRGASARPRYALYSAALLSLPVCVAVTFCVVDVPASLQSSSRLERPADIPAKSSALPSQATAITAAVPMETAEATDVPVLSERVVTGAATMKAVADDNSESPPHSSLSMLSRAAPCITVAYVVGVACFLLRLSTTLWSGHRLRTRTARVTDAKLLKLIADQADRVKLKCVPVVAYCERVAVPTVLGVLRPMVLLPASLMTGLTPDDFAAIIRHELAHIRRYDLWMNLLQRVIESLLFFHPAVWFISRRLSAEREVCCDDLVVSSGCEPMHYAGALLRLAELCAISRKPGALALAATGDKAPLLERRIERLMNWGNTPRLKLTRAGMAGLLLALVSLIVVPGIAHTWAQAQAPGGDSEPTAQSQPIRADKPAEEAKSADTDIKPKHGSAIRLFRKWQENARTDGKIPGGAIGSLARTVAYFIERNPTDERVPKFTELLERIDMSRDWTQAEAVVLLDDVTAIYDKLPGWVGLHRRPCIHSPIRSGKPLPEELSGAAWGQPAENGLRAAWLLEPVRDAYPLGTALKSRILFHNTGKKTVIFPTEVWHQPGHKARNATGAVITVSTVIWEIAPLPWAITIRLAPGEYAEVGAHGIAIGARNDEDNSARVWVGAWIEAKEGDEVTFQPSSVVASEDAWTMPKDRKTPAELWKAIVEERIGREAPLPAVAGDREQIIRRVTFDLIGVLPTQEEIAAFTADKSPDALAALGKRLLPRVTPFAGNLPAGEIKFRVTAADPEVTKRLRVVTSSPRPQPKPGPPRLPTLIAPAKIVEGQRVLLRQEYRKSEWRVANDDLESDDRGLLTYLRIDGVDYECGIDPFGDEGLVRLDALNDGLSTPAGRGGYETIPWPPGKHRVALVYKNLLVRSLGDPNHSMYYAELVGEAIEIEVVDKDSPIAQTLRAGKEYEGKTLEEWLTELGSSKMDARMKAKAALARIGQPAVASLVQFIEEGDPRNNFAAKTLGEMGPESREAAPRLLQVLRRPMRQKEAASRAHQTASYYAMLALERMPWAAEETIPVLREMVQDESADRKGAMLALAKLDPEAVSILRECMEDDSARIRRWATDILAEKLIHSGQTSRLQFYRDVIDRDRFDANVPHFLPQLYLGDYSAGRDSKPHPLTQEIKALYRQRLEENPDPQTAWNLARIIQGHLAHTHLEWTVSSGWVSGRRLRVDPAENFVRMAEALERGFQSAEKDSELRRGLGTGLAKARLLQGDWQGMNAALGQLGEAPIPNEERPWLAAPPTDWTDLRTKWQPAALSMRSGDCSLVFRFEKDGRGLAGAHVLIQVKPRPSSGELTRTTFPADTIRSAPNPTSFGYPMEGKRPRTRYAVSDESGMVRFDKLPEIDAKLEILIPTGNFTEEARDWGLLIETEAGRFEKTAMIGPAEAIYPHHPEAQLRLKSGTTFDYPKLLVRAKQE
ncbi:MAG: M56 family metallopeptidase [Planctomycetota bacterium]|jgi:beta-lactamase regulating signal transducer with metallopeptidase domain